MKRVFADSQYWIALTNPRDQWHEWSASASKTLNDAEVVTTEPVLTEVLNFFTRFRSAYWSQQILRTLDAIADDPNVRIVPQTHDLFEAGLERYRNRLDQGLSLTDCMSVLTMEALQITEVLTRDRGFQAAGFLMIE